MSGIPTPGACEVRTVETSERAPVACEACESWEDFRSSVPCLKHDAGDYDA